MSTSSRRTLHRETRQWVPSAMTELIRHSPALLTCAKSYRARLHWPSPEDPMCLRCEIPGSPMASAVRFRPRPCAAGHRKLPPIARLSGNVRQPHRVLANAIARHEAQRWLGAAKVRVAAAKHDGAQVELILIDETKLCKACCKLWPASLNSAIEVSLQPAHHRHEIIANKCRIRAHCVPLDHATGS